jgi:hypothetical protein
MPSFRRTEDKFTAQPFEMVGIEVNAKAQGSARRFGSRAMAIPHYPAADNQKIYCLHLGLRINMVA